jgi:hypothetical protein
MEAFSYGRIMVSLQKCMILFLQKKYSNNYTCLNKPCKLRIFLAVVPWETEDMNYISCCWKYKGDGISPKNYLVGTSFRPWI